MECDRSTRESADDARSIPCHFEVSRCRVSSVCPSVNIGFPPCCWLLAAQEAASFCLGPREELVREVARSFEAHRDSRQEEDLVARVVVELDAVVPAVVAGVRWLQ